MWQDTHTRINRKQKIWCQKHTVWCILFHLLLQVSVLRVQQVHRYTHKNPLKKHTIMTWRPNLHKIGKKCQTCLFHSQVIHLDSLSDYAGHFGRGLVSVTQSRQMKGMQDWCAVTDLVRLVQLIHSTHWSLKILHSSSSTGQQLLVFDWCPVPEYISTAGYLCQIHMNTCCMWDAMARRTLMLMHMCMHAHKRVCTHTHTHTQREAQTHTHTHTVLMYARHHRQ